MENRLIGVRALLEAKGLRSSDFPFGKKNFFCITEEGDGFIYIDLKLITGTSNRIRIYSHNQGFVLNDDATVYTIDNIWDGLQLKDQSWLRIKSIE